MSRSRVAGSSCACAISRSASRAVSGVPNSWAASATNLCRAEMVCSTLPAMSLKECARVPISSVRSTGARTDRSPRAMPPTRRRHGEKRPRDAPAGQPAHDCREYHCRYPGQRPGHYGRTQHGRAVGGSLRQAQQRDLLPAGCEVGLDGASRALSRLGLVVAEQPTPDGAGKVTVRPRPLVPSLTVVVPSVGVAIGATREYPCRVDAVRSTGVDQQRSVWGQHLHPHLGSQGYRLGSALSLGQGGRLGAGSRSLRRRGLLGDRHPIDDSEVAARPLSSRLQIGDLRSSVVATQQGYQNGAEYQHGEQRDAGEAGRQPIPQRDTGQAERTRPRRLICRLPVDSRDRRR